MPALTRSSHPEQLQTYGLCLAAGIIALLVFLINTMTLLRDAFAVLYVLVVLLIANACGLRAIIVTGTGCITLTCISFVIKHFGEPFDGAYLRLAVSITAIGVATMLSVRDRRTRDALSEQVRMLAFTHDTVIVRDAEDTIIGWNDGATKLYGWHSDEAIGSKGTALLHGRNISSHATEELQATGQWSGEITRKRRDGQWIVLDARWITRLDSSGRACGVIEFGADLTEQKQATAERERSEQQYSAIFQAVGFAIYEVDCSIINILANDAVGLAEDTFQKRLELLSDKPYIRDANHAGAELAGQPGPRDMAGTPISALFVDPKIWIDILRSLVTGKLDYTVETTFTGPEGREVDVVLRVTRPTADIGFRRILVMALDVTERNEAQMKLRAAHAELAHADRITTLGQLAVSIAHEVNQPLSAITTFANSGQRWLTRTSPNIDEALSCFDQIAANSSRAAEVITRVRALTRKETSFHTELDLGDLVKEVTLLLRKEIAGKQIEIRTYYDPATSLVSGDRIQLQQIIMNVMMNAIQAMSSNTDRARILEIHIKPAISPMTGALMSFEDTGPGFNNSTEADLFEPFVTTKAQGMGMGLSICREIACLHGGAIDATNRLPYGAAVTVTLPLPAASNDRPDDAVRS
ncbi:PAS domain-containing sensor histidine kinase [Gluconobacter albidus]|uniref:PAS domain-containing sensor histidine kinase n=1 Tax=Gluconobacter albidus TaxID=318683 RepID=UPI0030AFE77D